MICLTSKNKIEAFFRSTRSQNFIYQKRMLKTKTMEGLRFKILSSASNIS